MAKKSRLTKKFKREGQMIKHGGYSFLMKGELPENRRYIKRYLTAAREGLIRDLGPTEDDLTTAQIIIIDRIVSKLGVIRCIEEHTRENSVMVGRNLTPALSKNYIGWNNSVRIDLDKLGIHKKVGDDRILTPFELAAKVDREVATKKKNEKLKVEK